MDIRIHYNVYRRGDFIQFLNGVLKLAHFPVLLSGASADFTFLRSSYGSDHLNLRMKTEFLGNFLDSFSTDAKIRIPL
ncbi:hypothetical protein T10_2462 [Trichinella papuae]|uniref:Uncharacterized protein n=1 Tax=Trichinella papuae TaxID=268474 RepID=A0A0V1MPY2_9BILA|nr:hypothetical protein T10_2462 [Trichinella papuae]